ncbi:hypothetical protein QBC43DRAFT_272438 [Cladorrhinum sp. PSN259]|nr:hypothetical protein QBC43DRAFT_272438 [Cladorrhinum sp. PSN259]
MRLPTTSGALTGAMLSSAIFTAPVSAQEPMPSIVPYCIRFHLVSAGNTCASIASRYAISRAEFLSLNPAVNSECTNLWPGYRVCTVTTSHLTPPSSATASSARPSPTVASPMPGVIRSCAQYHFVAEGDSCANIAGANGITVAQFAEWNALAEASCSEDLWLGYLVCVAA